MTNAKVEKIAGLIIRPAASADLHELAVCWGNKRDTYPSVYPNRLANSSLKSEDRLARSVRSLEALLRNENNVFSVACLPADDANGTQETIAGYMIWSRPEAFRQDIVRQRKLQSTEAEAGLDARTPDEIQDPDPDPECDHDLAAKLRAESLAVKERFAGDKRLWMLQQLFVHPSYHRRGVGTALIEHGLRFIREQEQKHLGTLREQEPNDTQNEHLIGLTSSPQGEALYERNGFQSVYWFNPHFRDIDAEGNWYETSRRWPLMIK